MAPSRMATSQAQPPGRVGLPFHERTPAGLMTKDLTLHLDEFGQRAFERLTPHRKGLAAAAVRTACLYYLADRDSGRRAWQAPRFSPEPRVGTTLRVQLDDVTWEALADEARNQGVTVELCDPASGWSNYPVWRVGD